MRVPSAEPRPPVPHPLGSVVRESVLRVPCSPPPATGLPAVNAVRLGFGDRVRVGDKVRSESRPEPVSALPYRALQPTGAAPVECDVPVLELENSHLRAVFLPGYGGRLWSLVDKSSGRELLQRPDAIELVADGVRGAWFPGGIEWNLGRHGHWPLTASPVGAGVVHHGRRTFLRMWAWERQHRALWRLDALLPEDGWQLHVAARVTSHADREQELTWRPSPGAADTTEVGPGETVLWITTLTVADGRVTALTAPSDRALDLPLQGPSRALDLMEEAAHAVPEVLRQPDGWGRLEVEVGHVPDDPAAPLSGAVLGAPEQSWLDFARTGELRGDQAKWPQTGDAWEARLSEAVPGWERDLLVGQILWARGEHEAATQRWASSLAHSVNGPALHCLSVTAPDAWDSFAFAERAYEADPWDDDLLVAYLHAPKTPPRVVLRVVERLPEERRRHPEVRRAEAAALRSVGRVAEADALAAE